MNSPSQWDDKSGTWIVPAQPQRAVIPPRPDGGQPDIVQFPDNWPGVTFTDAGLVFADDVTLETFEKLGNWLGGMNNKTKLWIADWLMYAERREWGHTYDQLMALTGLSYDTLRSYASVGRSVPIQNRIAGSNMSLYAAVASLPGRQQKVVLAKAVKNNWTRDDAREEVKRLKAETVPDPDPVDPPSLADDLALAAAVGENVVRAQQSPFENEFGDSYQIVTGRLEWALGRLAELCKDADPGLNVKITIEANE